MISRNALASGFCWFSPPEPDASAFRLMKTWRCPANELAQQHEVAFEAEAFDGDDSLRVVGIERRFMTPDPDRFRPEIPATASAFVIRHHPKCIMRSMSFHESY